MPEPSPSPSPTSVSPFGSVELPSIPSNFEIASELVPAWGTGAIAGPEVDEAGSFRFICNPAHLSNDDPIVYPGQPGKAHLHQFFGNTAANAHSTYESLRTTGESTCNSPLNRSAYWMPAMMNGKGKVVRPDYVSIYYKRLPASDPKCDPNKSAMARGICVDLPRGLRFVFGFNMTTMKYDNGGQWPARPYFTCDGKTANAGHENTIPEAAARCPTSPNADGSYNKLGASITAPDCWDGKNLDSPDHRSHMAYPSYGSWGYLKCPATHPYVVPTFTLGAWYTVDQDLPGWHLSSDVMPGMPPMPAGSTFHADWFGAWDDQVLKAWHDNCLDKRLSCSGADLGNGKQLKMFNGFSWNASPRVSSPPQ
jgi:hypothetical protein